MNRIQLLRMISHVMSFPVVRANRRELKTPRDPEAGVIQATPSPE